MKTNLFAAVVMASAFVAGASARPAAAAAAARQKAPRSSATTVTIGVGQGVHFATGRATRKKTEADLVLKYLPPQSPDGWRYNVITQQMEYQARLQTQENFPVLEAGRIESFQTPPNVAKITVGDVNRFSDEEYRVAPGRYLLVRGLTDNKHYLVRLTKMVAPSNNPQTWRLSLTYKPVTLALGAAGAAGKNIALAGTLTFRERIGTEKIIDLDLATGRVTPRFDGFGPSRNPKGEYAYIDQAGRIVIAGPDGRERATLPAPASAPKRYGQSGPTDAVLSPDGSKIAVEVERVEPLRSGGVILPGGIPLPTIAVIDRSGKEIAAFYEKTSAAWTPDGRLVAAEFVSPGLYISDGQVRELKAIPNAPQMRHVSGLAVSPDGSRLAFAANNRVWTITLQNGGDLKQLTQSGRAERLPVWSPDGKYIALWAEDPDSGLSGGRIEAVRVADGKTTVIVDQQGTKRMTNSRMSWR